MIGWNWTRVAKVAAEVKGNQLHVAIPRARLGLPAGSTTFDFKWSDSLQRPGDVTDFYLSGDVAPEGRMRYRYAAE